MRCKISKIEFLIYNLLNLQINANNNRRLKKEIWRNNNIMSRDFIAQQLKSFKVKIYHMAMKVFIGGNKNKWHPKWSNSYVTSISILKKISIITWKLTRSTNRNLKLISIISRNCLKRMKIRISRSMIIFMGHIIKISLLLRVSSRNIIECKIAKVQRDVKTWTKLIIHVKNNSLNWTKC